jgi:uncharacterized protein YdhG (YjbR/CyaY superfamily)
MDATKTKFKTVDQYLSVFPENIKSKLQELRSTIKKTAPQAEELISYNMPAFKLHGMLVYYAAYKEHIGFYPTPSPIEAFKKELAGYEVAKGSIKFPIDKPVPLKLVIKIVKYKMKENLEAAHAKVKKKK